MNAERPDRAHTRLNRATPDSSVVAHRPSSSNTYHPHPPKLSTRLLLCCATATPTSAFFFSFLGLSPPDGCAHCFFSFFLPPDFASFFMAFCQKDHRYKEVCMYERFPPREGQGQRNDGSANVVRALHVAWQLLSPLGSICHRRGGREKQPHSHSKSTHVHLLPPYSCMCSTEWRVKNTPIKTRYTNRRCPAPWTASSRPPPQWAPPPLAPPRLQPLLPPLLLLPVQLLR